MEHEAVQSKTAKADRQPEVKGSGQQPTHARTPVGQILHLQRTIGNRTTGRLIQAKLKATHSGDLQEHDAGEFAQGTAQAETQPKAAPLPMSQEEKEKKEQQRELSAADITPPPQLEVSTVLSRQFNSTAAPSGNVVQRQDSGKADWWDLIPKLPPLPGDKKPKEANWDVGPAGQVDSLAGGWGEQPNFPNGLLAHEGSPELDSGKTTFIGDWKTLQTSWNESARLSNLYNIQAKTGDEPPTVAGQPAAPAPKSVEAPKLDTNRPAGKAGFQVESIFKPSNELDVKTPFDPKNLEPADRKVYDDKKIAVTEARGNRIKAEITINDKLVNVSKAWSKLRQAQIKAKEAEKKAEQKDLEAEKAAIAAEKQKMETIIKGAEGIIGAGAKKDVAAGAISLAGTLTSLYFDDKLDQLNIKVAQLDSQIAALETTYAMEDVKQAKDDIKLAMNEVKKALPDLDTAVAKQEAAYNDFGASIEAFAKKLGLSADDVKTIRTAAAALPMIDETIGQISQIEAACEIPGYSSSSGLGAGLITNLDTFKTHLANLKAFKAGLSQLKQKWEARRAAARSGSGLPPNPAAP